MPVHFEIDATLEPVQTDLDTLFYGTYLDSCAQGTRSAIEATMAKSRSSSTWTSRCSLGEPLTLRRFTRQRDPSGYQ